MPEYVGSIPSLELSRWLLALPALPLLAAAIALLQTRRPEDTPSLRAQALLHTAPWVALLLAVSAAFVRLTSMTGAYRLLIAPGWQIVHLGSHELSFGLSLDTLSLPLLPVLCAGWAAAVLWAVVSDVAEGSRKARLAGAVQVAGASSLVVLLADGLPALLLGLSLGCVAIGAGWLELGAGRIGWARALGARVAALTLSVLATMTVFWAMSGVWTPAGFAPDLRPRVVVMQPEGMLDREERVVVPSSKQGEDSDRERRDLANRTRTSRLDAKGYLTMTAMPGARVYLDSSSTAFARAPFVREPLPPGMHSAKVVPGPGSNDIELPTFRIDDGVETMLIAASGTTSFREAATLTMVKHEGHSLALGAKPSEHAAAAFALLCFLLMALSLAAPAQAALGAGASLAFGLLPAMGGGYAMARVSAMHGAEPTEASVVGAALLTALLGASALHKLRGGDGSNASSARVLLLAFGAQLGLCGAAAASGATAASATHLLVAGSSTALVLLTLEVLHASPLAPRWVGLLRLGIATLSLLPPLSGALSLLEAMRAIGASGVADWAVTLSLLSCALGAAASTAAAAVVAVRALRPADAPAQPRNKRLKKQDIEAEPGPHALIASVALPSAAVLALACVVTGPLSASSFYDAPLSRLMAIARLPIPPGDTGAMLPLVATALVLVASGLGWMRAKQLAKSTEQAPSSVVATSPITALTEGLNKAGTLIIAADTLLAGPRPAAGKDAGESRQQESR